LTAGQRIDAYVELQ